jgi:DNA-binding SARP family transcriptional activator
MKFGLLGSLSVVDGGREIAPTAPKLRQMLALLLINANRTVSMSQFVDELWECTPPPSALAAVHTYVTQLRRVLRDRACENGTPPGRLVTRAHGYRLRVRPGELDLTVFTDEVRIAGQALARGEYVLAAQRLRVALDTWRSQALADVVAGPLLRTAIFDVERSRINAIVRRVHADLRLGRHNELVGELSGLVRRHPFDESLTAHLMVALYRSGRQADALTTFHRHRTALWDEYATSPSVRLRQLHTHVLTGHPSLEQWRGASTRSSLDLVALGEPVRLPAQPAVLGG